MILFLSKKFIEGKFDDLNKKMTSMETELKGEIASMETKLNDRMTSMETKLKGELVSMQRKYELLDITMNAMTRISALSEGNMESMPMRLVNSSKGYKSKKKVRVPGF